MQTPSRRQLVIERKYPLPGCIVQYEYPCKGLDVESPAPARYFRAVRKTPRRASLQTSKELRLSDADIQYAKDLYMGRGRRIPSIEEDDFFIEHALGAPAAQAPSPPCTPRQHAARPTIERVLGHVRRHSSK